MALGKSAIFSGPQMAQPDRNQLDEEIFKAAFNTKYLNSLQRKLQILMFMNVLSKPVPSCPSPEISCNLGTCVYTSSPGHINIFGLEEGNEQILDPQLHQILKQPHH